MIQKVTKYYVVIYWSLKYNRFCNYPPFSTVTHHLTHTPSTFYYSVCNSLYVFNIVLIFLPMVKNTVEVSI